MRSIASAIIGTNVVTVTIDEHGTEVRRTDPHEVLECTFDAKLGRYALLCSSKTTGTLTTMTVPTNIERQHVVLL